MKQPIKRIGFLIFENFGKGKWCRLQQISEFDFLILIFFQLSLSSHVSSEDFQLGYSMSGHVARSFEKYISFQITHLAFVRRKDFQVIDIFFNFLITKSPNFISNLNDDCSQLSFEVYTVCVLSSKIVNFRIFD